MLYRVILIRILIGSLVFIISFGNSLAKAIPSAKVEHTQVFIDSEENPNIIEIRFLIQARFVVGYVTLFYRSTPNDHFKKVELHRDANLRYVAKLPRLPRLEYYLELTSEKGQSVNIGSPTMTYILDQPQLKEIAEEMVEHTSKKEKWKKTLIIILVIVVGIIGIGITNKR